MLSLQNSAILIYNENVKRVFSIFIIVLLSSIFASQVFAASISFQNTKTQLSGPDEEFTTDATFSINAADNTQYYLRGLFYKSGTSGNYCGFTWNTITWFNGPYSGEGFKSLLPINITNNSWTGQIKARIDSNDSACKESGEYKFRVLYYTANGNSNQPTQTEPSVEIVIPTPTPSPTPTPEPTKTPVPTKVPTPTKISSTTAPANTNTLVPTKSPTSKPSATTLLKKVTPTSVTLSKSPTLETKNKVLGVGITISPTMKPNPTVKVMGIQQNPIGIFFIIAGSVFLAACGILGFYTRRKT